MITKKKLIIYSGRLTFKRVYKLSRKELEEELREYLYR